MKKLLILGTNQNIANKEVIDYAKAHGIYTIMTDWFIPEKSPLKLLCDEYWMISTSDIDLLEQKCRETGVNGVFGGTDYSQDIVVELSERLGLPCYCDRATWHYSRNKGDFKDKCKEYGVPVARDWYFSDVPTREELDAVVYPVVVKPTDRSGNLGMSFCYSEDELIVALDKAKQMSESGRIIVEQMLTGHEYAVYYAFESGKASLLSLSPMLSQPGMPGNCYSITLDVCDRLPQYLRDVAPALEAMFKGIGCRDGYTFVEFMTDKDGNFYALEMGHRLSGDMIWIPFKETLGFNSLEWMVNYQVSGKNDPAELPVTQTEPHKSSACAYILWSSMADTVATIEGLDTIAAKPWCTSVHKLICEGAYIDAYRYAHTVTFFAESAEELCACIEEINNTVRMKNADGDNMLIYYDNFELLKDMYKKQFNA